jgi:hypothetical protein
MCEQEFVPKGRTINAQFYLEVMGQFLERIQWLRPAFHENKNWFLLHDNAPACTLLTVQRFL